MSTNNNTNNMRKFTKKTAPSTQPVAVPVVEVPTIVRKPRVKPVFSPKNRKLMNFAAFAIAIAYEDNILDEEQRKSMLKIIGIDDENPLSLAELEQLYENNLDVENKVIRSKKRIASTTEGKKWDTVPVEKELSMEKVVDMNMKKILKKMEDGDDNINFDIIIKTPKRKTPKRRAPKAKRAVPTITEEEEEDEEDEEETTDEPVFMNDGDDSGGEEAEFEEDETEVVVVAAKSKKSKK